MAEMSKIQKLEQVYRVNVIVPFHSEYKTKIIAAVLAVDQLQYGKRYDQVMFESAIGIEKYRTLDEANPTEGERGKRSEVPSIELSFTLPRGGGVNATRLRNVLDAIVRVHPWEEPEIIIEEVMVTRCFPTG